VSEPTIRGHVRLIQVEVRDTPDLQPDRAAELLNKLCECGCGRPAPLAKRAQNGYRAGQPQRYIRGHSELPPSRSGSKLTAEQRLRLSVAHLGQKAWNKGKKSPKVSGVNHYNWKGGHKRCATCGTQTHSYRAVQCQRCAMKRIAKGRRLAPDAITRSADRRRGKPGHFRGKKRPELSGPRSHLWRGGVTPKHELIRKSVEYKAWRQSVFERDGFACIQCGTRGNIEADHIKSFSLFPDLRFDVANGRTLCVQCHKATPSYLNRWYQDHERQR
jgi:5-methylcytosine-specific restriction endonuclease McrA